MKLQPGIAVWQSNGDPVFSNLNFLNLAWAQDKLVIHLHLNFFHVFQNAVTVCSNTATS